MTWCVYAKRDVLRGVHQPDDKYKVALYGPKSGLSPLTEKYATTGEVKGQGYVAGGQILRGYQCEEVDGSGCLGWSQNPIWKNATISANTALIYNSSKGNKALAVIEFDKVVSSANGPFVLPMPELTPKQALIRIL